MTDKACQRCMAALKALNRFRNGVLARRSFLRLCAGTGISLSGLWLARAHAQTPSPPPTATRVADTLGPASAAEPLTDQQKFLRDMRKSFSGATLRVLSEGTPPSVATREIMKQEFIPLTGINVEWEQLPLDQVLAPEKRRGGRY
jgi:hypothetical protein